AEYSCAVGVWGRAERVTLPSSLRVLEDHAPGSLALIVGPEGGWSDEEVRQAEQAGCIAVSLGPLTLRADAVAITAIAVARSALGEEGRFAPLRGRYGRGALLEGRYGQRAL